MKKWPTLYDKSKTGKIKIWRIWVEKLYGEAGVNVLHGYEDGKLTKSLKVISKGKNVGKSNETTPYQQACKEAQAMFTKKVDQGMVEKKRDIGKKINYFPMLAIKFDPKKHDISKGYYLQPKLNGVRCIAVKSNKQVKLYSRKGKDYTEVNDSLAKHLSKFMLENEIWDGEIYVHNWNFKRIIEAVKKKRPDTELLEFHRYDIPSEDKFKNRWSKMASKIETNRIKQVRSILVNEMIDVKMFHDAFVAKGYEGIILRDPEAGYIWNHRDKALLKHKEFIDEEFRIIGYKAATGTHEGAIIFKCRRKDGNSYRYFDCTPKYSLDDRRKMYQHGWKFVGKMLTVRYQELSVEGSPIFPVGIVIRDYE